MTYRPRKGRPRQHRMLSGEIQAFYSKFTKTIQLVSDEQTRDRSLMNIVDPDAPSGQRDELLTVTDRFLKAGYLGILEKNICVEMHTRPISPCVAYKSACM